MKDLSVKVWFVLYVVYAVPFENGNASFNILLYLYNKKAS